MKSIKDTAIQKICSNISWAESKAHTKEYYEKDEKRKALLRYIQRKCDHILKVLYNEYAEE